MPLMLDPTQLLQLPQLLPTRKTRGRITMGTLLFCAGVIGYLILKGDPANALHKTSLEYAFMLAGTVALAYSLSAVADNYSVYGKSSSPTTTLLAQVAPGNANYVAVETP